MTIPKMTSKAKGCLELFREFADTDGSNTNEVYTVACEEIFDPLIRYETWRFKTFLKLSKRDEIQLREGGGPLRNEARTVCWEFLQLGPPLKKKENPYDDEEVVNLDKPPYRTGITSAEKVSEDPQTREKCFIQYCKRTIINRLKKESREDLGRHTSLEGEIITTTGPNTALKEKIKDPESDKKPDPDRRSPTELADELMEKIKLVDKGKGKIMHLFLHGVIWFGKYKIKESGENYNVNRYREKFGGSSYVYDYYWPKIKEISKKFRDGVGEVSVSPEKAPDSVNEKDEYEMMEELRRQYSDKKPEFLDDSSF